MSPNSFCSISQAYRRQIYTDLSAQSDDGEVKVITRQAGVLSLVAVSARDWAGLASIVIGELHHLGWNLDFIDGFAHEVEGSRQGVIIAGIRTPDEEKRETFHRDAARLEALLKKLAVGREGTMSLLSRAAERIEIYEAVREELETMYRGDIPRDISGAKGELVLFISARSDQYLGERKAADLAWMVKTNNDLIRKVRRSRGRAAFKVKNLRTESEHLTGINLVGYERDISFQNLLTALSYAWPGSTIRHQRRYTTPDGIVSVRVEMSGPSGLPATRQEMSCITSTLNSLLVSNRLERLVRIHRYGGRENYARALIPLLMKECRETGINQAYLALETTETFAAKLKLLVVTLGSRDSREHDNRVLTMVDRINEKNGLSVASFKSPSNYGDIWVDVIDITVQRSVFMDMEEAYLAVKAGIREAYGRFRDFDQGMRLNDVKQLEIVKGILKDIPDGLVTDFYYRLEDFLRASVSSEELARHIQLAFETIRRIIQDSPGVEKPAWVDVENDGRREATIICCGGRGEIQGFRGFLDVVRDFKVTASMIEWSGAAALLLRLQSGGHALEAEERERVLGLLEERLRNDRDR